MSEHELTPEHHEAGRGDDVTAWSGLAAVCAVASFVMGLLAALIYMAGFPALAVCPALVSFGMLLYTVPILRAIAYRWQRVRTSRRARNLR